MKEENYYRNNIKKEIKTLEEICGKKHIELFDIELIIDDYHSNFNMDKLSRKHEYIYNNNIMKQVYLLDEIMELDIQIEYLYDKT